MEHIPLAVDVTVVVALIVAAINVWWLVCNERTYKQRMRILDIRRCGAVDAVDAMALSREYDAVSYEAHMKSLAFFKDANRLYGPLTQKYMATNGK